MALFYDTDLKMGEWQSASVVLKHTSVAICGMLIRLCATLYGCHTSFALLFSLYSIATPIGIV